MSSTMIIAVSDLHLGDPLSNKPGFKQFIDEFLKPKSDEITHLVLLGDVFDFWRRDSPTVLLDNLDILNSISSLGFHVIYAVGNHDFNMIEYIWLLIIPQTSLYARSIKLQTEERTSDLFMDTRSITGMHFHSMKRSREQCVIQTNRFLSEQMFGV